MKRSILVLLLLLLPLTLAPRTAFTPEEPEDGQALVQARLPEHRVRVGSTVSAIFRVANEGSSIEPAFSLHTDDGLSQIVGASPGCTIDRNVVTCAALGDGEQRIIRASVRVSELGEHTVSFQTPAADVGSFVAVARGKTSARR